ncbi:MAG: hypothetical protein HYR63_20840 [Proteobacteria bacterium]|nr:hypothetical protein [Pseudomonadota bacterium]MBI3496195.1 hypothetical protein [Pseudomonadota bacterium]
MEAHSTRPLNAFAAIRARIATLPRIKLALTPTPLEEAPRLAQALGARASSSSATI